ncbi:MAG: hypothetical protein J1F64_02310 [Oscillospiraceae bacterium]|nr:hypothetical protein [Oscillospiraceae bacterium]
MGLFGGGYMKEGPGVDKNAPKKKGIFLYTEIFIRKFWKIVQINLLYTLFSLPMLALTYFIAPVSSDFVARIAGDAASDPSVTAELQMGFRTMFALVITILWGSGPASAGYAYILRCFAREEHAWIWSDFLDKIKSNLKQSAVVIIVDIAVLILEINAVVFYFSAFKATDDTMWLILTFVTLFIFMLYTFIHFYIYQIMVTFECTAAQLYKNSILFAFAKLPMNLFFFLFTIFVLTAIAMLMPPAVVIMLYFIAGITFSVFPIAFYSSRSILKVINLKNKQTARKREGDE